MGLAVSGSQQDYKTTASRIRRSQSSQTSRSSVSASSGFTPTYYYHSSGGSSSGGGGGASAPSPTKRQRNLRRRGRSVSYHGPRTDIGRGWGVRVRIGRLSDGSYGVERWTTGGSRQTPSWS
jgi:hypothetical protein